jgi:uncharacterized membrane protein YeaQ/YmgE (transglycosylase-associated protein family)
MCGWVAWIVIGAVAGWLASIVMKTNKQQGFIADVVVGIVGAFIGGLILPLLGVGEGFTGFNVGSLFTAFVGAVIFLGLLRYLRGGKGKRRR